jgi:predicted MPP superfamily phosphohydrolase
MSGLAYARLMEPTWLEVTHRSCKIGKLRAPIDLVHLSDLHASEVVPNALIERAVARATDLSPDLICVTGDFVTNATGFDRGWYGKVLGRLSAQALTFAVLGNHDGGLWAADGGGFTTTREITTLLEGCGIRVLTNRSEAIAFRGQEVQIVGVGDMWAGDLQPSLAFANVCPSIPAIVLSHNPDSKAMLSRLEWELILCGHTHGGQVVVPGLRSSPAPVWDRNYISGLKTRRGRWIHVSRGVGNVSGIRFNCRPEVTRLRLAAG